MLFKCLRCGAHHAAPPEEGPRPIRARSADDAEATLQRFLDGVEYVVVRAGVYHDVQGKGPRAILWA
eukprot:2039181-Lingulodinium_polyedra.AAC.1